jgi:hypothetical protein
MYADSGEPGNSRLAHHVRERLQATKAAFAENRSGHIAPFELLIDAPRLRSTVRAAGVTSSCSSRSPPVSRLGFGIARPNYLRIVGGVAARRVAPSPCAENLKSRTQIARIGEVPGGLMPAAPRSFDLDGYRLLAGASRFLKAAIRG